MVNPPPRVTYPLSDFVIDEKYLGSKEYWRRSGLTKSRYMISNKGRVKGPRGTIRSHKRGNSIEVRNLKGNPQFFRLARLMREAFTTFEYDNKEHRFCWLDGDKDNQTLSNLGVQVLRHEVRASYYSHQDQGGGHGGRKAHPPTPDSSPEPRREGEPHRYLARLTRQGGGRGPMDIFSKEEDGWISLTRSFARRS